MAARGKAATGEASATERTYQRAVELMRGGMSGKAAFERIAEETGESAGTVQARYYRVARKAGEVKRRPRSKPAAAKAAAPVARGRRGRRRAAAARRPPTRWRPSSSRPRGCCRRRRSRPAPRGRRPALAPAAPAARLVARPSACRRPWHDGGVQDPGRTRAPHLTAILRGDVERVTPLELFFDLVFVLAITQCTALMAHEPDVGGPRQGAARARRAVVVVGRLRLADERRRPRGGDGAARDVRRDGGDARRGAVRARRVRRRRRCCSRAPTAVVRVRAHRAVRARQPRRPGAPRSRWSALAVSTGDRRRPAGRRGVHRRARCRARSGRSRSLLDMGGPLFFGAEGWQLVPGHFAERHGLIVIIALGESIVAIGVGAEVGVDAGVVVARRARRWRSPRRCGGSTSTSSRSSRRAGCRTRAPGRERNEIARDSFSYLHFPMVAGHRAASRSASRRRSGTSTTRSTSCRRPRCSAAPPLYLLAHVAFRWRNVHRFSRAAARGRRGAASR